MAAPLEVMRGISSAVSMAAQLREILEKAGQGEAIALLDDLSNELAGTNSQIVKLKEQMANLLAENAALKASKKEGKQKQILKSGCYEFEGEPGLYCISCYNGRGIKSATNRVNSRLRACPACGAAITSG